MAGCRAKVWLPPMLVVLVLAAMTGCRQVSDESQIRSAIKAVATAVEAGVTQDAVAPVSHDFDGNDGDLDRLTLANMVRITALRGEHIGVSMGPIFIQHPGERIVATFTVTLTSGRGLLPDQMGLYQVESTWRKESGKWRCYSAHWKHAL